MSLWLDGLLIFICNIYLYELHNVENAMAKDSDQVFFSQHKYI